MIKNKLTKLPTNRKEKRVWLGFLLSALCLFENFLLILGLGYLGRY